MSKKESGIKKPFDVFLANMSLSIPKFVINNEKGDIYERQH